MTTRLLPSPPAALRPVPNPALTAVDPPRPATGAGQAFSDDPFARVLEQNRQAARLQARREADRERPANDAAGPGGAGNAGAPSEAAAGRSPGPSDAPAAAGARTASRAGASAADTAEGDSATAAGRDDAAPASRPGRRAAGLPPGAPRARPGATAPATATSPEGSNALRGADAEPAVDSDDTAAARLRAAAGSPRADGASDESRATATAAQQATRNAATRAAQAAVALAAERAAVVKAGAGAGQAASDREAHALLPWPPGGAQDLHPQRGAGTLDHRQDGFAARLDSATLAAAGESAAAGSAAVANAGTAAVPAAPTGSAGNAGDAVLPLGADRPALAGAPAPGDSARAPQAQASLPAPPGSAGFAPQLAAQVTLWLKEGVQEAQLHLNPAELGPVQVSIALDGQAAQVSFAVERPPTRQALEQALPGLAATLADAGFTLAGGGVFDQPPPPPRQEGTPWQGASQRALAPSGGDPGHPGRAGPPGARVLGVVDVYA